MSAGGRPVRPSGPRHEEHRAMMRTARYDLAAIEGFILVVHTSLGGDQLVFRYPPVTRTTISEETWTAVVGRGKPSDKPTIDPTTSTSSLGTSTSVSSSGSTKLTTTKSNEPPTSPNEPPVSISYSDTYSPYDMPSVMLCNILSPKQALCDRIFHTIIDQYRFFGFPTLVQKDTHDFNLTDLTRSDASGANAGTKLSSSNPRSASVEFKPGSGNSGPGINLNSSTSSLTPSPSQHTSFSSTQNSSAPQAATTSSTTSTTQQIQHRDELTMFHLVMVVPKEVSWEISKMGQKIAIQIASALRHEQDRCHYVTTEVFKMLRLRERWFTQHRRTSPDGTSPPPTHTALTYEILQHSSLAQLVKNIYHSIRDEGSVQLTVNNWVNLSLNTRMIFLPSTTSTDTSVQTGFAPIDNKTSISLLNGTTSPFQFSASASLQALKLINEAISNVHVEGLRPLRPYHTILLLDHAKILEGLPNDASPTLRRVVERAVPTKSFRELQLELGIPIAHLYRIASHLVYWKCARVIDVLTRHNVYILNPSPDDSSMHMPFLIQTFESQFHGVKLIELLNKFSTPKKLADILQSSSSQSKFVDMVTWLLRQDLIVQLHQYCFLMCPKLSSTSNSDSSSMSPSKESSPLIHPLNLISSIQQNISQLQSQPKSTNQTHHTLSPVPLTHSEKLFLSQHDNGSKEFKIFIRLCPYFRGSHHLTEIAWRQNITKEELSKVIGMYKHLTLTTHYTEEPIRAAPSH